MNRADLRTPLTFLSKQNGEWVEAFSTRGMVEDSVSTNDRGYKLVPTIESIQPILKQKVTIRFTDSLQHGMRVRFDGIDYQVNFPPVIIQRGKARWMELSTEQVVTAEFIEQAIISQGRLITLNGPTSSSPRRHPTRDAAPAQPAAAGTEVYAIQTMFEANETNGTNILATDIKFLVPANTILSSNMTIDDGAHKYNIKNVMAIRPGNETIMYSVQART